MLARRDGFTLVEQVVAIGVLLILGAAVVPFLVSSSDRARVAEAAASLESIVDATTQFNEDVRAAGAVTPFPGQITQLTTAIVAGNAAYQDVCGDNYSAANAAAWKGPYINRTVPATGLTVGIGTAQNQFTTVISGTATLLTVVVTAVTIEDAQALNLKVDGDEGGTEATAGTVRWGAVDGEGRVTLNYHRPVPTC